MSLDSSDLADFRLFGEAELRAGPRGHHGHHRAQRHRQDHPARGRGLPGHPAVLPGGAAVRPWCGPGPSGRWSGPSSAPGGRPLLVEAEVVRQGRSRAQVNRQPVRSRRDLAEAVPVTVFSPEDLAVVQGGPGAPAGPARRRPAAARPDGGRHARRGGAGPAPARRPAAPGRGRLAPEVRRPSTCGTTGWARPGPGLAEARQSLVEPLAARWWPTPTPALARTGRTATAAGSAPAEPTAAPGRATLARRWSGPRRRPAPGRRPPSGPTATTWASSSGGRDARDQASQGEQRAWPWPCAWPSTGWSPSGSGRRRSCCSTTCSPSSTRTAAGPWSTAARRPGPPHHGGPAARRAWRWPRWSTCAEPG